LMLLHPYPVVVNHSNKRDHFQSLITCVSQHDAFKKDFLK